ncbi:hypothetical protein RF007C_00605 [Ruminococcus flavefaciens 007c]|uniref:Uncharacterized protein n=1 Tax=Ruminococcus flavefaciens 007c TaxID=1341157 RepID=W7UFX1_RUMFL|nr:hypothetical protein RF007C_00605 [Ruminococcus flavefaciens 007c]
MLMPMQDAEVTDYLGAHRGADIIPGPFANGGNKFEGLWHRI